MAPEDPELRQIAHLREAIYEFLSSWFAEPQAGTLAAASAAARDLDVAVEVARGLPFYGEWKSFLSRIVEAPGRDDLRLTGVYGRLFDPGTGPVSLWQSAYVGPDVADQGEVIAAVQQVYLQAGLKVSGPDPADHLAWELSFLSLLCGLEAEAWESADLQRVGETLERQRSFLADHLCRWLPLLSARLARFDDDGMYLPAARLAWAIARHDCDMVPLLTAELSETEYAD